MPEPALRRTCRVHQPDGAARSALPVRRKESAIPSRMSCSLTPAARGFPPRAASCSASTCDDHRAAADDVDPARVDHRDRRALRRSSAVSSRRAVRSISARGQPGQVGALGVVLRQTLRDRGQRGDRAGDADPGARLGDRHGVERLARARPRRTSAPARSPSGVGGSPGRHRSVIRTQPMSTDSAPIDVGALAVPGADDQLGRAAADVGDDERPVLRLEVADRAGEGQPRPPRRRRSPRPRRPSMSRVMREELVAVARRRGWRRWRPCAPARRPCAGRSSCSRRARPGSARAPPGRAAGGVDALAEPDDPHLAVHVAQVRGAVVARGQVGDQQADGVGPAVDRGNPCHAGQPSWRSDRHQAEPAGRPITAGPAEVGVTDGGARRPPTAATWSARRRRSASSVARRRRLVVVVGVVVGGRAGRGRWSSSTAATTSSSVVVVDDGRRRDGRRSAAGSCSGPRRRAGAVAAGWRRRPRRGAARPGRPWSSGSGRDAVRVGVGPDEHRAHVAVGVVVAEHRRAPRSCGRTGPCRRSTGTCRPRAPRRRCCAGSTRRRRCRRRRSRSRSTG